ncbi:MAG TPA: helix-turn-helix transcriptional regulator [Candidatus Binatia bacterium]
MAKAKDFLNEIVSERTAKNGAFPRLVAEAEARRSLARKLASKRAKRGLSQTVVAARMGTSASVVSKLESGADVKLSTLQRYYSAIGEELTISSLPI